MKSPRTDLLDYLSPTCPANITINACVFFSGVIKENNKKKNSASSPSGPEFYPFSAGEIAPRAHAVLAPRRSRSSNCDLTSISAKFAGRSVTSLTQSHKRGPQK